MRHLLSVVDLAPDITEIAKRLAHGAIRMATHGPLADVAQVAQHTKEASFMAAIAARDDDDALLGIAEDLEPLALCATPNKTTGEENTPVVVLAARRRRGFERRAITSLSESLKSHQRLVTAERSLLALATAYADVLFAVDALLGNGIYSGGGPRGSHATRATCSLGNHVARFAAFVHSGHAGKTASRQHALAEAYVAAWSLERPTVLANDVLPCALAVACRADRRGDRLDPRTCELFDNRPSAWREPVLESIIGRRPARDIFKPLYLAQIELDFQDS